jgi:hypothetical protein
MKAYICVTTYKALTLTHKYNCLNVTGPQVCFSAGIFENFETSTSWTNTKGPLGVCISEWFPLCLFHGKKEGDEIELKFLNERDEQVNVILQLHQSLDSDKIFQQLLYERTTSFAGVYLPIDSKDNFSELLQCCYIIAAHDQYAHSIKRATISPDQFRYHATWLKCITEETKIPPNLLISRR